MKSQEQKVKEIVRLYNKIKKLYPSNNVTLMVHGVDVKSLNQDEWEVQANLIKDKMRTFLSAYPIVNGKTNTNLCLFGKE